MPALALARSLLLGGLVLVAAGCSAADLREPALRQPWSADARAGAQALLDRAAHVHGRARWLAAAGAQLTLSDDWNSRFVRWLTPLDDDVQRMDVLIAPHRIEVTFLDGDDAGETIGYTDGSKADHRSVAGQRSDSAPGGSTLYLESMRRYLELPMLRWPVAALAAPRQLAGRPCARVFCGESSGGPTSEHNQYVYWIDAETHRVELIEFTYRAVMNSYSGALRLSDYRRVDGVLVPFRLAITDPPGEEDPDGAHAVHTLVLERYALR